VDVPEHIQLERSSTRDGVNEDQIRAIMSTQISRDERLTKADDVIDNSGSLQSTKALVLKFHSKYLELAKR